MKTFRQQSSWKHRSLNQKEALEQPKESLELLSSSQKCNDIWLLTSGYKFSLEKAKALKKEGLTGVVLSLHHYDPEEHNAIQGYKHSYGWVLKAADHAQKAGLMLCLQLRPDPAFISMHNLLTFAKLAKKLGAAMIQITEINAQGKLSLDKHLLEAHHLLIVDDFVDTINFNESFKHWPVVSFQTFPDKQPGRSNLFINANGKLQKS